MGNNVQGIISIWLKRVNMWCFARFGFTCTASSTISTFQMFSWKVHVQSQQYINNMYNINSKTSKYHWGHCGCINIKQKFDVRLEHRNCIYFIRARCINMIDGNILKGNPTAVLVGRMEVALFVFRNFLFVCLFCNKCYQKLLSFLIAISICSNLCPKLIIY